MSSAGVPRRLSRNDAAFPSIGGAPPPSTPQPTTPKPMLSSGPTTPAPVASASVSIGGSQFPMTGRGPVGPAAGGAGSFNPYEVIPTIRVTGKGKMMAVKVQMLDDGLAIFQVQVTAPFTLLPYQ